MKKDANLKNFVDNVEDLLPSKNDTQFNRILAIGDIHGDFSKLMRLWDKVSVTKDDKVIFLGDYLDRGAGIAETLEWIIEQSKKPNVVVLRGNHEQMMLDAFKNDREFMEEILRGEKKIITNRDAVEHEAAVIWLINGCEKTCNAFLKLKEKHTLTIDEIVEFVASSPLSHLMTIGDRNYFFCHAGVKPGVPLDKQSDEDLLWIREKFLNYYDGYDVIIVGHTPTQKVFEFDDDYKVRPMRFLDRNVLMLDTGSYRLSGEISCVDILTGEYWQS